MFLGVSKSVALAELGIAIVSVAIGLYALNHGLVLPGVLALVVAGIIAVDLIFPPPME